MRVRQAGFSNADAGEFDHVSDAAESARGTLLRRYGDGVLALEPARPAVRHRAHFLTDDFLTDDGAQ